MKASYEKKQMSHKDAVSVDQRMEQICIQLLFAALGALLGNAKLLFEVRPFGISLCAAAAGKFFPATALGALAFALWRGDYLSVLGYAAVAFARLALSLLADKKEEKAPLFEERAVFRVLSAALASFLAQSAAVFRGEFKTYYLLRLINYARRLRLKTGQQL